MMYLKAAGPHLRQAVFGGTVASYLKSSPLRYSVFLVVCILAGLPKNSNKRDEQLFFPQCFNLLQQVYESIGSVRLLSRDRGGPIP